MSDIPSDLFREILTWLPGEPLLQFRRVCKSWRSMIDDSQFLRLQFERRKIGRVEDEEEDLMFTIATNTGKLYSVDLSSPNFANGRCSKTIEITSIANTVFPVFNLPLPLCRGLILVPNYGLERLWALVNICTGDMLLELPSCDHAFDRFSYGLGFDASIDDYKVVSISLQNGRHAPVPVGGFGVLRTCIYSLKLGVWRMIEDMPNCIVDLSKHGVFCNGALHWIRMKRNRHMEIIALNLTTDTYCSIPMSPAGTRGLHLDAFDGQLFLSATGDSFGVWVLQDYGGENTWVKLVTLRLSAPYLRVGMRAVAYMKANQQVVIQYGSRKLVWFDVKEQMRTNEITVMGDGHLCSYQMLPASLLKRSLNGRLQLNVPKKPFHK